MVTENARVLVAKRALEERDAVLLGSLMYASHISSSLDFGNSCEELDLLVSAAKQCGALGARLMGGGFGGCTINLVFKKEACRFLEAMGPSYLKLWDLQKNGKRWGEHFTVLRTGLGDYF